MSSTGFTCGTSWLQNLPAHRGPERPPAAHRMLVAWVACATPVHLGQPSSRTQSRTWQHKDVAHSHQWEGPRRAAVVGAGYEAHGVLAGHVSHLEVCGGGVLCKVLLQGLLQQRVPGGLRGGFRRRGHIRYKAPCTANSPQPNSEANPELESCRVAPKPSASDSVIARSCRSCNTTLRRLATAYCWDGNSQLSRADPHAWLPHLMTSTPKAAAMPSMVTSSNVGPTPPLVITA